MRRFDIPERVRGAAVVGALVALFGAAACAQILGYDDLTPRGEIDSGEGVDAGTDLGAPDTFEASVDTGPPSERVPDRPPGSPVASGKGKTIWLIVKHYYLDTEMRDGTSATDAWKAIGWDIDHVCTGSKESEANTGTCKRVDGASPDVLVDGDGCRDNNFGQWVIPNISTVNPTFEDDSNKSLLKGSSTWIFTLSDLDDGPDDPYAPGSLIRAASTPTTWDPKFDGTDVRQASSDSVTGRDVGKPLVVFPNGYMKGQHWVSGEPASYDVRVPFGDLAADLPLAAATFDFVLDTDHTAASLGTVAGAIPWSQFETLLRPIAEKAGFCPGSDLYNSFVLTVSKFPDVSIESPTLQDLSMTCDGISLGLGFDLAPIAPVTEVVDPPPPAPSKCADAGVDGG